MKTECEIVICIDSWEINFLVKLLKQLYHIGLETAKLFVLLKLNLILHKSITAFIDAINQFNLSLEKLNFLFDRLWIPLYSIELYLSFLFSKTKLFKFDQSFSKLMMLKIILRNAWLIIWGSCFIIVESFFELLNLLLKINLRTYFIFIFPLLFNLLIIV